MSQLFELKSQRHSQAFVVVVVICYCRLPSRPSLWEKRKILFQTSPPFAFGILSKTFPPSFRSKWRSLQPWLKRFIQAAAPNQVLFSLFSSFLALIYIFLPGSLGFFFFLRVFVLVCPKCEISCAAGRLNNRWETSPPPPARESPSHIPIKVERKDFSCPFLSSSPTRWV